MPADPVDNIPLAPKQSQPYGTALPIFADAGRTIVTDAPQLGRTIEIDIETEQVIRAHVRDEDANAVCVSHDGRLLARSSAARIQVIDRHTGTMLVNCKYQSKPGELAFFPDDRVLLSAHDDGSVRATHISTGQSLGVLYQPERPLGPIVRLQIDPDGPRVAIDYAAHTTRVPVLLGK